MREGDAADFPGIARLSEAVHGRRRSIDGIRWLYENNPAGRCRLWLAADRRTREIVGLRPVFPWRLNVGGREVRAAQAGDAMTHPRCRGRGIFSALVEAAWARMRADGVPFAFSFSTPGSLSVYHKMRDGDGNPVTHNVLQFERFASVLSLRALGSGVPAAADVLYRTWLARRLRLAGAFEACPVERFGAEFDQLWVRSAPGHGVLTVRDSAYLNWRFIDPPSGRFHVVGLRSRGVLAGYIAFDMDARRTGWIADLFCAPDAAIMKALLAAALHAMSELGCVKASIWSAARTRVSAVLGGLGFVPRGDVCPMAVHVYHPGAESAVALDPAQWFAWFADRDVEHVASRSACGAY